jgi:HAD superfamily hydrolase (TIGR01490 family)
VTRRSAAAQSHAVSRTDFSSEQLSFVVSCLMNLALFDFDGTITSNNTWTPFLKAAVRPRRLVIGRLLLLPIIIGHRIGVVPPGRARELANWVAFAGERSTPLQELGIRYATDVLPKTVQQWALDRIEWHTSQGDEVLVVSASLDIYLGPWCRARNLPYVCTTLEERAGRLTGRCVHGDCSGVEKVRRIKERCNLRQYRLVYAYGDTPDDREMLELAHRKFYRGKEVSSWDDVTEFEDPSAIDTAGESRAG